MLPLEENLSQRERQGEVFLRKRMQQSAGLLRQDASLRRREQERHTAVREVGFQSCIVAWWRGFSRCAVENAAGTPFRPTVLAGCDMTPRVLMCPNLSAPLQRWSATLECELANAVKAARSNNALDSTDVAAQVDLKEELKGTPVS